MKKFLLAAAMTFGVISCVSVNEKLGDNLLATNQKYDIYTAEIPLEDIYMEPVDSLSAYSSRRITFGSIRDDVYGLTRRGSVVTLVPVFDTVDFGKNPKFQKFRFRCGLDTTSVYDKSQQNILQNVNVYALTEQLDSAKYFAQAEVKYDSSKRITKGVPVLNGSDSLVFEFTEDFGKKYFDILQSDLKDMNTYTKKFPGIYFCTEDPAGNGGRINMFDFDILEIDQSTSSVSRKDNYAALYYSGEYNGERRDSLLMFYFSPLEFQDLDSLINAVAVPTQYVFNVDYHERSEELSGRAGENIYLEGGSGLKPVIRSKDIQRLVVNEITSHGGDPSTAVISKATVELPFTFPEDYTTMYRFPVNLSPTVKISSGNTVNFAGLTDASVATEDQGDINRSLCEYAPDITHHVQQIVRLKDNANYARYDVWFLIMWYETTLSYNSEASEMAEYYQQLAYYSYYNTLYGGGYSSYSSYGSSYSNYYSYMMMAQYASAAATTSSTETELDKDRYYSAMLNGPESKGKKPVLRVTYAIPKE